MTLADRIFELIKLEKNQSTFLKKINWETSEVSSLRANPEKSIGYTKLKSILDAYPSVSAEWLMRGEGEMQRNETSGVNVQVANGGLGHALTQHNGTTTVELLLASLRDKEEIIGLLKHRVGELEK